MPAPRSGPAGGSVVAGMPYNESDRSPGTHRPDAENLSDGGMKTLPGVNC